MSHHFSKTTNDDHEDEDRHHCGALHSSIIIIGALHSRIIIIGALQSSSVVLLLEMAQIGKCRVYKYNVATNIYQIHKLPLLQ